MREIFETIDYIKKSEEKERQDLENQRQREYLHEIAEQRTEIKRLINLLPDASLPLVLKNLREIMK
jgi:hypothetical protein